MANNFFLFLLLSVSVANALPELLQIDDECGEGASESCALNALQVRKKSSSKEGCHDVTEKDGPSECLRAINWARHDGLALHPDWYPNMTVNTSIAKWQFMAYNTTHPKCPRPCSIPEPEPWCANKPAPTLWRPAEAGEAMQVKALSYNLFWWHLFKVEGGRGNSAGNLIKNSMSPPYDVMGFQECEDKDRVLGPVGLSEEYTAFQGNHAICMAYRTDTWTLLNHGETDVAEDMRTEYYGTRGTQWMHLKHKKSGRKLFFVNHHGPLSVNSGGLCGGQATAHHLMDVMAKNAQVGDTLVLVGDFNANAASRTLQSLWPHLTHVYNSKSFGGVDNIFSNIDHDAVSQTTDLGSGGSDHHAISAVIQVGPHEEDSASSAPEKDSAAPEATKPASSEAPQASDVSRKLSRKLGACSKLYEQCGGETNGKAWSGATCCETGLTCSAKNQYYSQCIPGGEALGSGPEEQEPHFSVQSLEHARGSDACTLDPQTQYVIEGGWKQYHKRITDPRVCCQICEGQGACKAWVWTDWDQDSHGPLCTLRGGNVVSKTPKDGFVSGLPKAQAVEEASASAQSAV